MIAASRLERPSEVAEGAHPIREHVSGNTWRVSREKEMCNQQHDLPSVSLTLPGVEAITTHQAWIRWHGRRWVAGSWSFIHISPAWAATNCGSRQEVPKSSLFRQVRSHRASSSGSFTRIRMDFQRISTVLSLVVRLLGASCQGAFPHILSNCISD